MTTTTDELCAALEQSCLEVPYTVTRTEKGFLVELDLFTPEVRQRAQRLSINRTFAIDVRLDEGKRKARLTDTVKELYWGPGLTSGYHVGASIQKGAVWEASYSWNSSATRQARARESKPLAIRAAKSWVRQQLEANNWKVGGLSALFT